MLWEHLAVMSEVPEDEPNSSGKIPGGDIECELGVAFANVPQWVEDEEFMELLKQNQIPIGLYC